MYVHKSCVYFIYYFAAIYTTETFDLNVIFFLFFFRSLEKLFFFQVFSNVVYLPKSNINSETEESVTILFLFVSVQNLFDLNLIIFNPCSRSRFTQ